MENQLYLEEYYAGNGKKLRGVVDKNLFKLGGITQKDMDDFYSLANEVFTGVLNCLIIIRVLTASSTPVWIKKQSIDDPAKPRQTPGRPKLRIPTPPWETEK